MRAALGGGNQVDIALGNGFTALGQPHHRPVDHLFRLFSVANNWRLGQKGQSLQRVFEIGFEAVLIVPLQALARVLIAPAHVQTRAQHRLGPQHVVQAGNGKFGVVEVGGFWPKTHGRAGAPRAHLPDDFELRDSFAIGKRHMIFLAAPPHPDVQPLGEGIDHRHPHPVQAAGKLIVFHRELAPGMQPRQDHFNARQLFFGMQIHGHAAPVVSDFQRAVGVQRHIDAAGIAGNRFIHAIVDNLLRQVVGP